MSLTRAKLKRELARAGGQLMRGPEFLWDYLTYTRRADAQSARERRITHGSLPLDGEVAIYLVFPADGLLPSHLQTLNEIIRAGVRPVVVSNLPLTEADRARLLPLTARVIERPNLGYDFGGYREAILALAPDLPRLDRLYILNDSAWMLDGGARWFDQVRALDVDFAGATSNYGAARVASEDFRDIHWRYTTAHKDFHLASYALALGPRALRDPALIRFWRRFRLATRKNRVVRRGEIGFTQLALAQGWSVATTFDERTLDADLAALSDADLTKVFDHLVLTNVDIQALRDRTDFPPLATPEGRAMRVAFILMAVARLAAGYTLPYYAIHHRAFPFVKKSPLGLNREASDRTLAILAGLTGPMAEQALTEAQAIRAKKSPAFR